MELVDGHTLYPFYAHFWTPEMQEKALGYMQTPKRNSPLRTQLGLLRPIASAKRHLMYCPRCVENDRLTCGEAYWHRAHQAPGVYLCPIHTEQMLVQSAILQYDRVPMYGYFPLEQVISDVDDSPVKHFSTSSLSMLQYIASDAKYLLELPYKNHNLEWFVQRLPFLLKSKGYMNNGSKGLLNVKSIMSAVEEKLPNELLELLQCPFDSKNSKAWPVQILRQATGSKGHTLRYLLVLRALGSSIQELCEVKMTTKGDIALRGQGPWPCLNRASPHYGQLVITDPPTRSRFPSAPYDAPRFVYRCQCGYAYSCRSNQNPVTEALAVEYGPVWEAELRRLADDLNLTQAQIAGRLGTSLKTILTHGRRIGIARFNQRSINVKVKKYLGMTFDERRQQHRDRVTNIMSQNPTLSRSELYSEIANEYKWLRRNDVEWLRARIPPISTANSRKVTVNYIERDESYVKKIIDASKIIRQSLSSHGRPVRVTTHGLIKMVDGTSLAMKQELYPRTWMAINSVIESAEEFQQRQISFAYTMLRAEGTRITQAALKRKAAIRHTVYTVTSTYIDTLVAMAT